MPKHKVVHFEIPTTDFNMAKDFYGKIFGWNMQAWGNEYMMATTTEVDKDQKPTEVGGINGGFYIRKKPDQQPSIVVETESIDETLKAIKQAGGKVTRPKEPIGDFGFMAEFRDPDGNEISLWEDVKSK